jgi:hypothetical protein
MIPIVQNVEWAPGPVWAGAENNAPTGIRSPDHLDHICIHTYTRTHSIQTCNGSSESNYCASRGVSLYKKRNTMWWRLKNPYSVCRASTSQTVAVAVGVLNALLATAQPIKRMSKGNIRSVSRPSNMWSKLSNFVTIFYCSFLADEIQSVDSHFIHDGFFSSVPQCKYHLIILDNFVSVLVYLFVLRVCVCVSAAHIFDPDACLHMSL